MMEANSFLNHLNDDKQGDNKLFTDGLFLNHLNDDKQVFQSNGAQSNFLNHLNDDKHPAAGVKL